MRDIRYALRVLWRNPAFTAVAVLSLALGIGANTAIFSVLHHVVLNALPYKDPDRLMIVWETRADNAERWVAPANFIDWRRETSAFESLAAFDDFSPALSGLGEPERVHALSASGTFFTTLGTPAALGRTLVDTDDAADADGVAVLSDGFWRRVFGSAPDVLGRPITLNGQALTVVGVAPHDFRGLQRRDDLWITAAAARAANPRCCGFTPLARLAPGVSMATATAEVNATTRALAEQMPRALEGTRVQIGRGRHPRAYSIAGNHGAILRAQSGSGRS